MNTGNSNSAARPSSRKDFIRKTQNPHGMDGSARSSRIAQPSGHNPIGKLLGLISALPEIRREKVEAARRNIDCRLYDFDQTLDEALDKVLEELLAE